MGPKTPANGQNCRWASTWTGPVGGSSLKNCARKWAGMVSKVALPALFAGRIPPNLGTDAARKTVSFDSHAAQKITLSKFSIMLVLEKEYIIGNFDNVVLSKNWAVQNLYSFSTAMEICCFLQKPIIFQNFVFIMLECGTGSA
jgi:hypothetical protein